MVATHSTTVDPAPSHGVSAVRVSLEWNSTMAQNRLPEDWRSPVKEFRAAVSRETTPP